MGRYLDRLGAVGCRLSIAARGLQPLGRDGSRVMHVGLVVDRAWMPRPRFHARSGMLEGAAHGLDPFGVQFRPYNSPKNERA